MQQQQIPEIGVEDTNAQALVAKLSAIKKGYFIDEYAQEFVQPGPRKDVIMHRGYWGRVNIFKLMIERFLNSAPETEKQIISLGCGYDTLFFNLQSDPKYKDNKFVFYEVDLPIVVERKIKKIHASQKCHDNFQSLIKSTDKENFNINDSKFKLFSSDLTQLEAFQEKLKNFNIDYKKPTFIFAECVLTYIKTQDTDNLLSFFQKSFDFIQIMDYEMFNPNDPFGKQMVKNFQLKGCPLQGIYEYTTLQAQHQRLEKMGFKRVEIYDMLEIYNQYCDQDERKELKRQNFWMNLKNG